MARISLNDLPAFARLTIGRIAAYEKAAEGRAFVVYLSGDLGSGKTTFMRAFARELGIEGAVTSPTFVLMKNYPLSLGRFTHLVHIDAYRLESAGEFEALKPAAFLNDPHALVCIEWPEQVKDVLPAADLYIKFRAGEETGARDIEIV